MNRRVGILASLVTAHSDRSSDPGIRYPWPAELDDISSVDGHRNLLAGADEELPGAAYSVTERDC
jgi:hypothetical protein